MEIQQFGIINELTINKYILKNSLGMEVSILNYGGIIQSIKLPTDNEYRETVLGYDNLEDYILNPCYLGATIGRTAGRLKEAKLTIDDKTYHIDKKDNGHLLHGGKHGFNNEYMYAETLSNEDFERLTLSFKSLETIDGFPANLDIKIVYTLKKEQNCFTIDYYGYSDKKTYLNLTNHSYFNLMGDNNPVGIKNHQLMINSKEYYPLESDFIPSIKSEKINHSAFDFAEQKTINLSLNSEHEQIKLAHGIDHCFKLNKQKGEYNLATKLISPDEKVILEVHTTAPDIVIYTSNFIQDGYVPSGKTFTQNYAICFEAQEKPNKVNDSPNDCQWTTPDNPYYQSIKYIFKEKISK